VGLSPPDRPPAAALYERIAEKYGYTVDARLVQDVRSEQDVLELIGAALEE